MPTLLRYWGSHFKSGRQAQFLLEQFRPLSAKGWQCHLVVEQLPGATTVAEYASHGIKMHVELRPRRSLDLRCILRTSRLCKRLRADVFICDNIHLSPLIGARIASVAARIWFKRSMNSHYELCREPGFRERVAITTRISGWMATRVIAVSGAVKEELVDVGIPCQKVIVRLNPRRLERGGETQPFTRSAARKSLGYGPQDLIFVTVGHAVQVKGWDLLVDAFAQIAPELPSARLLLVGGVHRPEERAFGQRLISEVARHDLRDRVSFAGHVEHVSEMLLAGDVFVLPSRSEGCCNALVEAMECHLPCIATRVGSAPDLIRNGSNGLLVSRNDPIALAGAMRQLATNPPLLEHMKAQAAVPAEVLPLSRYAEQLSEDFTTCLGTRA